MKPYGTGSKRLWYSYVKASRTAENTYALRVEDRAYATGDMWDEMCEILEDLKEAVGYVAPGPSVELDL